MDDHTTLVLGATGKTGRRVAARLRLRGTPVRAASRSGATPFDWSDPAGWDAALRGAGTVWLVAPYQVGPVPEFVARAQDAGVRRLVLLSGRAADDWGDSAFGHDMRSAEDAVRSSALDWTVLRSSNFDQNFDGPPYRDAVLAGELALPIGPTFPEPFVDVEDIADAAVAVLTEPDGHSGRIHELTGPRGVTYAEATDLIGRVTGRPVTYKQVSVEEYVAGRVEEGWDAGDAHAEAAMYDIIERGLIVQTTDDLAAILGRAPRTFEQFVVRAAGAGAWQP